MDITIRNRHLDNSEALNDVDEVTSWMQDDQFYSLNSEQLRYGGLEVGRLINLWLACSCSTPVLYVAASLNAQISALVDDRLASLRSSVFKRWNYYQNNRFVSWSSYESIPTHISTHSHFIVHVVLRLLALKLISGEWQLSSIFLRLFSITVP